MWRIQVFIVQWAILLILTHLDTPHSQLVPPGIGLGMNVGFGLGNEFQGQGLDALLSEEVYPPVGIGQRLREQTSMMARLPGSQGKVLGLFPNDPLVTVHDLPSVHEPTTYTPSANPRAPNLRRRMYQNALRTSTKQGCNIAKIAVNVREDTKDEIELLMDGAPTASKVIETDLQLKVMNHLAWFAGVQDVQYCSVDDQVSHFTSSKNANGLPSWQTGCLFEDATVATLERPDNVPYQGALAHFLSDVDSRHAYAVIGTPGGDLGEFARGIGALEQLLGIEIAADQVDELLTGFLNQMGQFGRQYFYMMTDEEYQAEWYRLANVTPPLMPIDEAGRLRLIRTSSHPNAVGSDSLRIMLEDYDGRTFGAREEVTKATIEAFVAKHLNPFDELKAKLLFVVLAPRPPEYKMAQQRAAWEAGNASAIQQRAAETLKQTADIQNDLNHIAKLRQQYNKERDGRRRQLLMSDINQREAALKFKRAKRQHVIKTKQEAEVEDQREKAIEHVKEQLEHTNDANSLSRLNALLHKLHALDNKVHISERRSKRERLRQLVDLAKQAKLDGEVDFLQGMLKSVTSSLLSDVTAMQEDQEREADLQKRIADAAKTRRDIGVLEQRINKTKVDIAEFQAADTFMLDQEVVAERKQDLVRMQRSIWRMEHDKLQLTVKLDRERRSREKIIDEGKKLAKYYTEEAANMLADVEDGVSRDSAVASFRAFSDIVIVIRAEVDRLLRENDLINRESTSTQSTDSESTARVQDTAKVSERAKNIASLSRKAVTVQIMSSSQCPGQVPLVVPFVHSIVPDASMLVSEKRPPPPPEPISFKQGERFSARSLATPPNNREAIPRTGRQYRQVKSGKAFNSSAADEAERQALRSRSSLSSRKALERRRQAYLVAGLVGGLGQPRYVATQAAGGSFPSSPPEPNAPLSETDPAGTSEVAVGVYPEQRASGFFATGTDANVPQDGEAMAEPDIESTSRLEEDLFLQIGSTTEYVVRQVRRRVLRPSREQLGLPPLDEETEPASASETRGSHQSVDERPGDDPEVVFHPSGISGDGTPRDVDRGGSILAQSRLLAPRTGPVPDESTSLRDDIDSSVGRRAGQASEFPDSPLHDDPEVVHSPANGGRVDRGGGILARMRAARVQPQRDEDAETAGDSPRSGGIETQHDRGPTSQSRGSTSTDHEHDDSLQWLRSTDEPESQHEHENGSHDRVDDESSSGSGETRVESEGLSGAWAGELDAADEERIRAAGDLAVARLDRQESELSARREQRIQNRTAVAASRTTSIGSGSISGQAEGNSSSSLEWWEKVAGVQFEQSLKDAVERNQDVPSEEVMFRKEIQAKDLEMQKVQAAWNKIKATFAALSVGGKPPFPDKLVLQHLDILRKEKDALAKHNDSVVPAEPIWAHDFSRPPPIEMADDPAAVQGIGTRIAIYHPEAAAAFRRVLAEYFSTVYPIEGVVLLGKMNAYGEKLFEKLTEEDLHLSAYFAV